MFLEGTPPAPNGHQLVKFANGTFLVPRAVVVARWEDTSPIKAEWDVAEILCPYCGEHHFHGWGEGARAAHCRTGEWRHRDYYIDEPSDVPIKRAKS